MTRFEMPDDLIVVQSLRDAHLTAEINGWTWLEQLTAKKLEELRKGCTYQLHEGVHK